MKRKILYIGAIGMSMSLLSAQTEAADSITVGWFGGNWGDAFQQCIATPFTEKTGIKVEPQIGTSTVNLAQLEQQKASPSMDVVWLDSGVSEVAYQSGVLDTIDPASVPNVANLVDGAAYSKDGKLFAVSTGYYALGIAYNTNEIKTPPSSWEDLWNKKYAGAVLFPSPANALGVPTLYFLNQVLSSDHNMDATFARLKALNAGLFFGSSGEASNAFQTGEVVIGAFNSAPTWDLNTKGVPIKFVIPKEGAWGGDVRAHLVKGAPHKSEAEKFINYALTKDASSCLARTLYLGPSVKGVVVDAKTAAKMPWGANGSVKDLKLLDWWKVNEQRADLVNRWNREVVQ